MSSTKFTRRQAIQGLAAVTAAGATASVGVGSAWANGPVQVVSHRYPALEHYTEAMKKAVPGVSVNAQLMPFDKAMEVSRIALSSKADTIDILYMSDGHVGQFAASGWIRPLNDLWDKFKGEYKLDDFVDKAVERFTVDGKIYAVPHVINVMMLFYRKDIFDKAGKQPPKTMDEFVELAKFFNSPMRAGTASCLKGLDGTLNEAHWYLHSIGDGWFDKQWKPIFNNEKGVKAIETMKEVGRYAQKGFTASGNDECMITLQQDAATMALQWATRAGAMDDPKKSRVIGNIDWVVAPGGGGKITSDGYSISAFSKQDPETLFRILATSSSSDSMRGAASMSVTPRRSLLDDPDLRAKNRYYPAALAAVEVAVPNPALPEFYPAGEFITRRILQAVTGEMPVKQALDLAASETEAFLKARGYY
jgi:multiple sugar transport system substrate-binding protein